MAFSVSTHLNRVRTALADAIRPDTPSTQTEIDRLHAILKGHAATMAVMQHWLNAMQLRLTGVDHRSQITARRVFADRVEVES